jgi:AcrR family transcriptional regulator
MTDVATEAGISQGLAYRYFANKEAIFQALVEQALQVGPNSFQRIQGLSGTPGERLTLLVSKLVENRRTHPEFHQLLTQVLSDKETPGELRELVRKRMQILQDLMRQLVIEGQVTGEVAADDPDQLITAFFACLVGLTRWAVYNSEQFHFPDTAILLRILMPDGHRS